MLEVPAAQPEHQLLPEVHEAEPDLSGDVAHLLVRVALLSEAGEDRRSRELEIRRDDLEDVLAVDAGQACELVVVGGRPDLEKLPQGGDLVLAQPSVGLRLGDAELAQETGDELRRASDLGGQLVRRSAESARGLGQVEPEVLVGELALTQRRGRSGRGRFPRPRIAFMRRTRCTSFAAERAVLVVRDEDAQGDELLDPLDRAGRALGELRLGEAHGASSVRTRHACASRSSVSLRPFGARSSHWYMPQSELPPRAGIAEYVW